MGEEVRISDYDGGGGGKDDERVLEWEVGLPNADDLTPLCQSLIPAELASAFSITPEPRRSMVDVNRASQNTLSNLQGGGGAGRSLQEQHEKLFNFKSFSDEKGGEECDVEETELTTRDGGGSDSRTKTRNGAGAGAEEADSAMRMVDNFATDDSAAARTLKRPRLVWTPQLHKRFVDVVAHLGVKNAVPKTIMQLMNVEGLTRENVASHLQKYRLYLKRMQGLSNEGPSSSDHLFASTPLPPQSLHDSTGASNLYAPPIVPMPYAPPPQMVPVPHGFESHHHHHPSNTYNNMMMMPQQQQHQHQRDWSGNHFGGPIQSYHHRIAPTDK